MIKLTPARAPIPGMPKSRKFLQTISRRQLHIEIKIPAEIQSAQEAEVSPSSGDDIVMGLGSAATGSRVTPSGSSLGSEV